MSFLLILFARKRWFSIPFLNYGRGIIQAPAEHIEHSYGQNNAMEIYDNWWKEKINWEKPKNVTRDLDSTCRQKLCLKKLSDVCGYTNNVSLTSSHEKLMFGIMLK